MLINAMAYALNIPSMAITITAIDRITVIPHTAFDVNILIPLLFNPSTGIYENPNFALVTYVDYAVKSLFTRYDNFVDVFNSKSPQQFYNCMNSDIFPNQNCSQDFPSIDLIESVLADINAAAAVSGQIAGCRLKAALLQANFPESVNAYYGQF
jgi:hypothetical protein